MTRIKDETFEGASLTGTNGGSSVTGTVTLDSGSNVKDTYSSLHNTAASFVRTDFTGVNEVFITALLKVTTFSANVRTFYLTNIARIDIRSNGALRLSDSGGTQIGSDSSVLSTNTIYRIGIHYKRGVIGSGTDDLIEAFVAADGVAFGAAFASSSVLNTDIQATRLDFGNTAGATANTFYVDNVRIDDTAMPTDDVSGSTTNKTISVTITGTPSVIKSVQKPVSVTINNTLAAVKSIQKPIARTISNTISVIKSVNKPVSRTITTTVSVAKTINKAISKTITTSLDIGRSIVKSILSSITVTPTITKSISKSFSKTISVTVSAVTGKLYTISASVTSTVAILSSKTVQKNIQANISVVVSAIQHVIDVADVIVATIKQVARATISLVLKNTGMSGISKNSGTIEIKGSDHDDI